MKQLAIVDLIVKGACTEEVEKFQSLFGDSVEVTEETALRVAGEFDWDWAAKHLLTNAARDEYERARARAGDECDRAKASAWAEYERATARAGDEYDRAKASAWDEYERAAASALAEYQRAAASAWDEYERATARAFARLYLADFN